MAQAGLDLRALKSLSGPQSTHSIYVLHSTSDLGMWYDPVMMPSFDALAWLYWYLLRPDLWTHYRIFPSDRHIGRLLIACYITMYRAAEMGCFNDSPLLFDERAQLVQKQIRNTYCTRLKTPQERSTWYNARKVWLHNLPNLSDFPDFGDGGDRLFPDPTLFYESERNFQRFQNSTPVAFRFEGDIDSALCFIAKCWSRLYDYYLSDDDDDGDDERLQRLANKNCQSPQQLLCALVEAIASLVEQSFDFFAWLFWHEYRGVGRSNNQ